MNGLCPKTSSSLWTSVMNPLIREQIKNGYLVIDHETKGILCGCSSISVARSVSKPFFNTTVELVLTSLQSEVGIFDKDFCDKNITYQRLDRKTFPLPVHLDTKEWRKYRELILLRNSFHQAWEEVCRKCVNERIIDYFGSDLFYSVVGLALSKEPEKSLVIEEWAFLSGLSIKTAVQELTVKYQTVALVLARNNAIYNKYVDSINEGRNKEEIAKTYHEGVDLLIYKAYA